MKSKGIKNTNRTLNVLVYIFLCILIPLSSVFAGCTTVSDKYINVEVYFDKDAYYYLLTDSSSLIKTELNNLITKNKNNLNCYGEIRFTTDPAWAYDLNVYSVEFYVYANHTETLDLEVDFGGLKIYNNQTQSYISTPVFYSFDVKANTYTHCSIKVEGKLSSQAELFYFRWNGNYIPENPLLYNISGLKIKAEHIL